MKVLVAVASRHAATTEIAEVIGAELRASLAEVDPTAQVDVRGIGTIADLEEYDAVLVGSAIYLGRWLKSARHFVAAHAGTLRRRPVWLFSSGPVGEPLAPQLEPPELRALTLTCGANEHRLFAGRLRSADLQVGERVAVRAVHAEEGDYRDWEDIRDWGRQVADELVSSGVVDVTAESPVGLPRWEDQEVTHALRQEARARHPSGGPSGPA
jgi:menaquinone-dependent protoporphyrinogen oxidase